MRSVGMCALIAALAVTVRVHADPEVFHVDATLDGPVFEDGVSDEYTFGTTVPLDSLAFPGQGFEVEVSSGPSVIKGYDWQVTLDFADFFTSDFAGGDTSYHIEDIKIPDTPNPIVAALVTDELGNVVPGKLMFDDGNIWFDGAVDDLIDSDDIVRIHWAQVPEPATLTFLAIGAAAMLKRRRGSSVG